MLFLGAIIDADEVFINGHVAGKTEYMYPPRRYLVPNGVIRHGANLISIRLLVNRGSGGFVAGKKYMLRGKNWEVDLSGDWKYAIGAEVEELPQTTFFQYKPCGLFNAMFKPLVRYGFSGILWYQGESNTRRPDIYPDHFRELVREWREALGADLPVMYVQLPNFDDPTGNMPDGEWAEMREAQRKALSLPDTAMVVTIDAGESNDLHPQDKKTVGERLALCAQALVYGEEIEWSGPVCTSAVYEAKEKRVKLSFSHSGGALVLRNSPSRYFEVRSEGKPYVPVNASIEGECIYLDCALSALADAPVLVRYAGCNNPENPDLYNRAQLPASPFEMAVGPFK
jgi:sialate O-acetylesterase